MVLQIAFIVLFVAVGLFLLFGSVSARLKAQRASDWPSTTGVITESEVVEDRSRSATGQAAIAFVPHIKYEYSVNGEKLEGSRVAFGSITYDYLTASMICEKFKFGARVSVTYNPENPAEAVLAPQSREGLRSFVPGIFFIIVAILVGTISIVYR